jgi:hypothetical protein
MIVEWKWLWTEVATVTKPVSDKLAKHLDTKHILICCVAGIADTGVFGTEFDSWGASFHAVQ